MKEFAPKVNLPCNLGKKVCLNDTNGGTSIDSHPASQLVSRAGMVTIRFESELASFEENLNKVSSVSLLMTASTALAKEGLFELTQRPLWTQPVLSFVYRGTRL